MAKGQSRANREVRKPKKEVPKKGAGAAAATVATVFAKPSKTEAKPKKR